MIALYFKNTIDIKKNSEFISGNILVETFDTNVLNSNRNIETILKIENDEQIVKINFDSNKSKYITLLSKGWEIKQDRLLLKNKNNSVEVQDIIVNSNLMPPFLSENITTLKDFFSNKDYVAFVEKCELTLQQNKCGLEDYLMICYYAANVYYFKLKNFYKSRDLLLRAVSIKQDFHEAWCAWADILLDTGQPLKALDSYEKTIEKFKSRDYTKDFIPTNKTRGYEYPLEKITAIKNYKKNQIILEKLT
jgi:tetratricopeptide (TPR) repeat protein